MAVRKMVKENVARTPNLYLDWGKGPQGTEVYTSLDLRAYLGIDPEEKGEDHYPLVNNALQQLAEILIKHLNKVNGTVGYDRREYNAVRLYANQISSIVDGIIDYLDADYIKNNK